MNIEMTGRHVDITPALREFASDKLRKLERLLDGPLEVHVVLGVEKHRHYAEIQVKSRTIVLSSSEETDDLYASIGQVAEKLERQALRHKERVTNRKHLGSPRDPDTAAAIEASALESGGADEALPLAGPRVVRSPNYRVKPLSAEDAVLELETSGEDLLVFRDADTGGLRVLHRQRNGDYGLVEPDF